MMPFDFSDLDRETGDLMAGDGRKKLDWARSHMPVLSRIGTEIGERGTLKGVKISMALHTEAKTGVLALVLAEAGASVRLASCNPLSTDDPVALALHRNDILEVKARRGIDRDQYYSALNWTLDQGPEVIIDDGGDLVRLVHTERRELLDNVLGGCEETTTGIIRLKAMQADGKLEFPVIDVNDCAMKHLFDNRYGTGQSTLDGIMTATNLTLAGKRVVVAGYGWCGRGIAARMKGMGAVVRIAEVDPIKAVEAVMDGFTVGKAEEICRDANIIITSTGCKSVICGPIIDVLQDGCILANSGHFDNEIDVRYLEGISGGAVRSREHITSYRLPDGRTIHLLSEGRLVNLAAGQGHPVEIMDMSFALQAAGAETIATKGRSLGRVVLPLPPEIDRRVAFLNLESMGYSLDELTSEQEEYLRCWEEGT